MEFQTEFTPLLSLVGGILIGIAATLLMLLHGRIAGMTGILSGVIPLLSGDWKWRACFLAGAIVSTAFLVVIGIEIPFAVPPSMPALVIGGLIVGIGVTFGSGCTSGHGVCGIARFSPRSVVATLVFMTASFATVFVTRHVMVL